VSGAGLLALALSLPTTTITSVDMVLTKTKAKIGRIGSYLTVFLSAIFAVIVYGLPSSNSNGPLIIVIVLFIVQYFIILLTMVLIRIASKRFEKRLNFKPFFKFTEEERRKFEEEKKNHLEVKTESSTSKMLV